MGREAELLPLRGRGEREKGGEIVLKKITGGGEEAPEIEEAIAEKGGEKIEKSTGNTVIAQVL